MNVLELLVEGKSKRKTILRLLQATTGKSLTMKCIHNMIDNIRKKWFGGMDASERLYNVLNKFVGESGNIVEVSLGESDEVSLN